tara:strand:- start:6291 stop:6959 length:669 start_codon:yes stop_codon:yes gene_type:complete
MAGDRFNFTTASDDARGVILRSDDQKNKQANGSGNTNGQIHFDSDVTFNEKVNFKIPISGTPTGSIVAFAGVQAPTGWLMCDGRLYTRADYVELARVLGKTFKDRPLGDGQAGGTVVVDQNVSFYVPDLRGRVVAGFGDVSGWPGAIGDLDFGDVVGAETHKLSVAEMPSHNHTANSSGYTKRGDSAFEAAGRYTNNTSMTGGDQPHNNIQPTMALNYIIKT